MRATHRVGGTIRDVSRYSNIGVSGVGSSGANPKVREKTLPLRRF
jgi:hypothetical protein